MALRDSTPKRKAAAPVDELDRLGPSEEPIRAPSWSTGCPRALVNASFSWHITTCIPPLTRQPRHLYPVTEAVAVANRGRRAESCGRCRCVRTSLQKATGGGNRCGAAGFGFKHGPCCEVGPTIGGASAALPVRGCDASTIAFGGREVGPYSEGAAAALAVGVTVVATDENIGSSGVLAAR